MKDTIGKILEELLQREGAPTKEDFSGMLGISVKTLYNITKGKSFMDFDQVVKASEILNFNIAEEFYQRTGKMGKSNFLAESSSSYSSKAKQISVTVAISGTITAYENFPVLLTKFRSQARELGFEIN